MKQKLLGQDAKGLTQAARIVRESRRITLAAVKRKTRIAAPTLSNWENGHTDPQLSRFLLYLRAFGLGLKLVDIGGPGFNRKEGA